MSAALKHPPARMTVDEFLDWDSGDVTGARWQLVDGEPLAMAPASFRHGAIQSELSRLLGNHLVDTGLACVGVTEPGVVPRVRARENYRVPDLGFTFSVRQQGVMTADPVLLIEIMSPNNVHETRASIWAYTTIPSVREILVVHSTRIEAEMLRRGDGGWPEEPEIVGPDGMLTLESIGFSTPLAAVYRTSGLL